MDKVIIDGVDVSGCEHYRAEIETKMPYGEYEIQKDKCHYSGIEIIQDCKGNKGCIYKQLKRLQAENEELKQLCDQKDELLNSITRRGIELEQENERLKEEIRTEKIYSSQIEELEESLQHEKAENEQLKAKLDSCNDEFGCKEFAELKEQLNRKDDLINDITNGGIQLQKECERLKEENKQLKKLKFKSDGIELLQDANLHLHKANVKYRQALQEIRDIARNEVETRMLFADEKSFFDFNNILAKINEVIGAEE